MIIKKGGGVEGQLYLLLSVSTRLAVASVLVRGVFQYGDLHLGHALHVGASERRLNL